MSRVMIATVAYEGQSPARLHPRPSEPSYPVRGVGNNAQPRVWMQQVRGRQRDELERPKRETAAGSDERAAGFGSSTMLEDESSRSSKIEPREIYFVALPALPPAALPPAALPLPMSCPA